VLLVKGERKGRRLVVELQGSEVKVKVIDAAVSLSAVLLWGYIVLGLQTVELYARPKPARTSNEGGASGWPRNVP
jgi:hypothetical protein